VKNLRVAFNFKDGQKIRISPSGVMIGDDKRIFNLTQVAIENSIARGIDIPLNVEHGFTNSYNRQAVGWFDVKSLEIKEDGVYASLTLNDIGKKLKDDKAYRYLSPEFTTSEQDVHTIDAIALTNEPNFKIEFNNKKQDKEKEVTLEELQKENENLKKELNSKDEIIKTQKESLNEVQKQFNSSVIDNAIASGKILPNQKEFAKSLNSKQLNDFIESSKAHNLTKELNVKNQTSEDDKQRQFNARMQNMGWIEEENE
jgi:phage I-like protein